LLEKALKYSADAPKSERYYIEAFEAFEGYDDEEAIRRLQRIIEIEPDHKTANFTMAVIYGRFLGEPELAIRYCKRTLEIDPLFKRAYNQMAYAYHELGKQDSSLWAIDNYIALAPDEPNPYDTRGDLYAYTGRIGQALRSYSKADELKPGFSTLKIGNMYLFRGEYARAESCYKAVASGDDKWDRSEARTYLAIVPLYQGKFEEALEVLARAIGADEMEHALRRQYAEKYRLAANIYLELGAYEAAVREALRARDVLTAAYPDNPDFIADFYAHLLARAGRTDEAEGVLKEMESRMDAGTRARSHTYWVVKGNIARARGDLDQAIAGLEKGLEAATDPYFHIRSMLGDACLEAGRLDRAVEVLESALVRYDTARVLIPIRAVKAHYSLGMAYEESGWKDKAAEQYETFLDIWKNADPGNAAIEDARQRLARLRGST
jgi:tetratricopeptide (TPR) repeat protein